MWGQTYILDFNLKHTLWIIELITKMMASPSTNGVKEIVRKVSYSTPLKVLSKFSDLKLEQDN